MVGWGLRNCCLKIIYEDHNGRFSIPYLDFYAPINLLRILPVGHFCEEFSEIIVKKVRTVRVTRAEEGKLARTVGVSGTLAAEEEVDIKSESYWSRKEIYGRSWKPSPQRRNLLLTWNPPILNCECNKLKQH